MQSFFWANSLADGFFCRGRAVDHRLCPLEAAQAGSLRSRCSGHRGLAQARATDRQTSARSLVLHSANLASSLPLSVALSSALSIKVIISVGCLIVRSA